MKQLTEILNNTYWQSTVKSQSYKSGQFVTPYLWKQLRTNHDILLKSVQLGLVCPFEPVWHQDLNASTFHSALEFAIAPIHLGISLKNLDKTLITNMDVILATVKKSGQLFADKSFLHDKQIVITALQNSYRPDRILEKVQQEVQDKTMVLAAVENSGELLLCADHSKTTNTIRSRQKKIKTESNDNTMRFWSLRHSARTLNKDESSSSVTPEKHFSVDDFFLCLWEWKWKWMLSKHMRILKEL